MAVKVFSVLVGIALVLFGLATIVNGQGIGPCGRFCGFQQSVALFFGQAGYNLVIGLLWVLVGALFVSIPWHRRRSADKRRGPQV